MLNIKLIHMLPTHFKIETFKILKKEKSHHILLALDIMYLKEQLWA